MRAENFMRECTENFTPYEELAYYFSVFHRHDTIKLNNDP